MGQISACFVHVFVPGWKHFQANYTVSERAISFSTVVFQLFVSVGIMWRNPNLLQNRDYKHVFLGAQKSNKEGFYYIKYYFKKSNTQEH